MDTQPTRGDLPDVLPTSQCVQQSSKGFILVPKIDLMITASAEQFNSLKEKPTKIFLVEDKSGEERKFIVSGLNAITKVDKLSENTMYTFRFISKTNEPEWAYVYGSASMVKTYL